jgi:hypothetical protein
MGALLPIIVSERPFLDCTEKVDENFAVGLVSWLGCCSRWFHYLTRWVYNASFSYVMARTILILLIVP